MSLKSKCKPEDAQKMLSTYPFGHKVISGKELNEKLMKDDKPFYYANTHMQRDNEMIFEIISSKTGEVIYRRQWASLFLDAGIIKGLVKDMQN